MSSIHNDPPNSPPPSPQSAARAKKSKQSSASSTSNKGSSAASSRSGSSASSEAVRNAANNAADPAPIASTIDHMHVPPKIPLSSGDAFDAQTPGASPPQDPNAPQTFKQLAKHQLLGQGIKGLFMLKPVRAMLSIGGLTYIRGAFTQVLADQKPLGPGTTMKRMLLGAVFGGSILMISSSIPLGILGAALAASGPGAIPIFAVIAALTAYGAAMGAYQAYQTCRPVKNHTHSVKLTKDGTPQTRVTLERERMVKLDRIAQRPKPTSLPPPATTQSATTPSTAPTSDDDAPQGVDAAAAAENAATQEDVKLAKQKAAVAGSLDHAAGEALENRQNQRQV